MTKVVVGLIGILVFYLLDYLENKPKREYIFTKKDLKELEEIERRLKELEEL